MALNPPNSSNFEQLALKGLNKLSRVQTTDLELREQTFLRHVADKFSAQDLSETWSHTALTQDRCNGICA